MNDAEKRKKVICGLEICTNPGTCSESCPYYHIEITEGSCDYFLLTDALALLKEQEPRVMTLGEIKDNIGVPVWVEYANDESGNGYGVPTSDYETYIMIFGANAFCSHNARTNNVTWRCWTSAPTEEQRQAVKWND